MPDSLVFSAINIHWPISELIVSGKKTVETRTYPLSLKYAGKELLIVETPGRQGKFKARIVGTITFSKSFRYKSRADFYSDKKRHFVDENSPWAWTAEKPKYGWVISEVRAFKSNLKAPKKRGIVFTSEIAIPHFS